MKWNKPIFEALEPRILLSATPVIQEIRGGDIHVPLHLESTQTQTCTPQSEVYIIDKNVHNYKELLQSIPSNSQIELLQGDHRTK